jgi:hypothetical protein
LAEKQSSNSNVKSKFDSEPNKGKYIIDIETSVSIATTKFQPEELEETEEGEHFFHS